MVVDPVVEEGAVHMMWHALHLVTGPYIVDGELATLPGFDPAKALARPSGTWIRLRDVHVAPLDDPGHELARHDAILVQRYSVEAVVADLMLSLFFPGAEIGVDASRAGSASPPPPPASPPVPPEPPGG